MREELDWAVADAVAILLSLALALPAILVRLLAGRGQRP